MLTGAVSPFCLLKEIQLTLRIVQYMETTQDMFIPQINIEIFFSLTCVPFLFLIIKLDCLQNKSQPKQNHWFVYY